MYIIKKILTFGLVSLLLLGCSQKKVEDDISKTEDTQIAAENQTEETPSEETPVADEEKEETPKEQKEETPKEEEKKEEDKTASNQTSKPAESKPASKPAETKPASKPSTTTPAKDVVTKKTETITLSKIAFTTTYKDDANLDKGKEQVITNGVDGAKMQEVEITYTNGKETSRKVLRTWEDKPANQIVARGTKVAAAQGITFLSSAGMLEEVNKVRANNGMPALKQSSSNDMIETAKRRVREIVAEYQATGYISHAGMTYRENILMVPSTNVAGISAYWNNSPVHFRGRIGQADVYAYAAATAIDGRIFAVELFDFSD